MALMGFAAKPPLNPSYRSPPRDGIVDGNVEKTQLHAFLALPAVERQSAGRVHGAAAVLEQSLAERLADGAESDGGKGAAVAGFEPHAHVCLADLFGIGDRMG